MNECMYACMCLFVQTVNITPINDNLSNEMLKWIDSFID